MRTLFALIIFSFATTACVDGSTPPEQVTASAVHNQVTIDCNATGSCSGFTVCPPGADCVINCTGKNSCAGTTQCDGASSCIVECTGEASCTGAIVCGDAHCRVDVCRTGDASCVGAIEVR